jgi:hypothetical protein
VSAWDYWFDEAEKESEAARSGQRVVTLKDVPEPRQYVSCRCCGHGHYCIERAIKQKESA